MIKIKLVFLGLMVILAFLPNSGFAMPCFMLGGGLCSAACNGDVEAIEKSVSTANADEKVCSLVFSKTKEIQAKLIALGVDPSTRTVNHYERSPSGRTALFGTIFKDRREMFSHLLNLGANINLADASGRTPLMHAVLLGRVNMVQELIDHGAGLNFIDKHEKSALCMAEQHRLIPNREKIIQTLVSYGAICAHY